MGRKLIYGNMSLDEDYIDNAVAEAVKAVTREIPKERLCGAVLRDVFERAKNEIGGMPVDTSNVIARKKDVYDTEGEEEAYGKWS